MANKLGQLTCFESTKNTGYGACIVDWKQIVGAFLFDRPKTFTANEIATLESSLAALAAQDVAANRMYPIHNFVVQTDGSEAPVIETFEGGAKEFVRDGDIDWTFQYRSGGACVNKALRTHNGNRYALFYDKDNKLLGYDLRGQLAAIPVSFYAPAWGMATGSTTTKYFVRFTFQSKYANEESQFVKAAFDLSEIGGLQDIDIILNSWNQDTGVANVTLQAACGAENVFDLYQANITTASFTASDEDGDEVTVTAVAPVAGNDTFNITLDTADLPDDGIVTLVGAAVSVLVGQGIEGYVIGKLELEVVGS